MDQLWDRADPVGYTQGLGATPFADTPSHSVLMQIAYGDHQVSMYAGAAEARSIGADAYEPGGTPGSALTTGGGRAANFNLFYGLKPVPTERHLHAARRSRSGTAAPGTRSTRRSATSRRPTNDRPTRIRTATRGQHRWHSSRSRISCSRTARS